MKKSPVSRRFHRKSLCSRLTVEPLESRLLLSVSPLSLDDQIILNGGHLTVRGTEGNDTFELLTRSEYRLILNGASRLFPSSSISKITLIADSDDTIALQDTSGDDTIYGSPNETRIVSAELTIEAIGAGIVTVNANAGGVDVAHLSDSAGDDAFISSRETSTLSGDGFSIRVDSVEYVHGYARLGGTDRAEIRGSDDDELFVGRTNWSRLSGNGYASRAKFFDEVVVYAGEGTDHARVYDSNGNDTLIATPTEATFSGDGFSNTTVGFDSVTAYASGGNDLAELVDSPGDDTLYGTPGQTTLFGKGFINRALGFDVVHAYARGGGNDIANLHDSPGNDRYVATAEWGRLSGNDFSIRAKFFGSIYAYADSGGIDVADLRGTRGSDTFESRPTHSWLRGNGYEHRVGAFDFIYAQASSGKDEAVIFDSDSIDELIVKDRSVQLIEGESGTVRQAIGFNVVTARLNQIADRSTVANDPGIDIRIERPGTEVVINGGDYLDQESATLGFQDAIDALPEEGGIVILPKGTFTLRQGLVLRDGVTLRGSGEETVLLRPNREETRLTVTASTGAMSIDVESTEGFQVGDDISILAYGQSNVANRRIARIEAGRIYLDQPIAISGTYAPEDSASVVNYFPLIRTPWEREGIITTGTVVENLVLDGNLDETTEAWRIGAPFLIHLEKAVDSVIRNVFARNANAGGVRLVGGHDNRVESTTVEKVRGHGIFTYYEADTVIAAITVRQAGYATRGVSGDGIFVVGSDNVRVENSFVEGNLRHGLHPGGDLNRGGVWINNISRSNGENGFHFCFDNFDILVTGNVLEDNAGHGVGGLGLGGEFGDFFNSVSDNLIRNNAKHGVQINGGSDNYIIGNTIVDNSQLRSGRFSGVSLANSTFVVVADNTIGAASGQPAQKFGVEESGTANDNLIVHNDTLGNVSGGVYVTGPTTVVQGHEVNN